MNDDDRVAIDRSEQSEHVDVERYERGYERWCQDWWRNHVPVPVKKSARYR